MKHIKAPLLSILLCLFFVILSQSSYSQDNIPQNENLVFLDLFESGKDGVSCYRIPSVVTAPNGDLVAAADQRVLSCGDLHKNKDINIVVRRSSDNGKSWHSIETVADYPLGESASDPSMIVDTSINTIFLFFNYMNLKNKKNVYLLKVTKSKDNGKTWSAPADITAQITKPEWCDDFKFITSGRGAYTHDGKLLHALVNLQRGVYVFGSNDHGENWYLLNTPVTPADESNIIDLADGKWMLNSRVNNKGMRFVHISNNEGKTWLTTPEPSLPDPGCNACIITHTTKDESTYINILLFSNANSKDKRENMTIKISCNEGKTWTKGKTVYAGSSAYSSMTMLPNGDIGLLFEKDNYKKISFVSFSPVWLSEN